MIMFGREILLFESILELLDVSFDERENFAENGLTDRRYEIMGVSARNSFELNRGKIAT